VDTLPELRSEIEATLTPAHPREIEVSVATLASSLKMPGTIEDTDEFGEGDGERSSSPNARRTHPEGGDPVGAAHSRLVPEHQSNADRAHFGRRLRPRM
jgi:hypothetical protein